MKKQHCRTAGFTLTEILVVVAILGVLAALLFTVFSRVRENGRSTVCQNNLKQLDLAFQQYAADNDGAFVGDRYGRQLYPYIKPAGWIECPTHEALSVSKEEVLADAPFRANVPGPGWYIYGYVINYVQLMGKLKNPEGGIKFDGQREIALPDAATTMVFGDDHPVTWDGDKLGGGEGGKRSHSFCDSTHPNWPTLHNGGANYVFLDGHVKWMLPDAIEKVYCSSIEGKQ